ncbi:hypothetical protein [Kribbella sp. NPDC055071]
MIVTITLLVCAATFVLLLYSASVRRRRHFYELRAKEAEHYDMRSAPTEPWLAELAGRLYSPDEQAENIVESERKSTIVRAVDFTYTPVSTSTASKCHVIAYDQLIELPPIVVLKKNPLIPSLEFESAAFNRTFTIESPDPRYASAFLTPQVMQLLLDDYTYLEWRIEGPRMIAWGLGHWTVPTINDTTYAFDRILALVPDFVFADYGRRVS